jgi:putative colanic acid biosynthesis UDP-glucose lipid carrier transferase
LAQIGGYRGLVDSQEKAQRRVDLDLRYVETWSVGLDLRILWRTIFKGFVSPGAY